LNTLEMHNLDLAEGDDSERKLAQVDEAVGRRLQQDVGTIRYTMERKFSERYVDFELVLLRLSSIGYPLSERLEEFIKFVATTTVFLLLLNLILVPVPRLAALAIGGVVKGNVGGFAEELYVLMTSA
jgi:hypothetical protein